MSPGSPDISWRIPPELEQPLPRPVRLSGAGITYCVIAAVFIAAGVGITTHTINDELRREAEADSLMRNLTVGGQETEATVTRLFTGMGYVVNYAYTLDGRNYSKGAFITSEHWQALQVGSPLAIRYLTSDPAKSYPESDPPNSQTHWLMVLPLAGMALFFMFSFAVIQLSAVLPKWRLVARGHSGRAVVTQCKEGSQGRSSGYFLYYEFSLSDGSKCQGKKFSGQPMAEGSTVTVLYDPNNPRRNRLYPMDTVRLAAA
jgi:hypothetical protein